ncbi:MAG: 2-phospho-L-lactate transferase, partial [bacterium]
MPRVTVLAGGVGGARFTRGLLAAMPASDVTIVGNVGDDLEHWGLSISPDLDTLLYTLTGRIHPGQGWGVAGDTREAMAVVTELGGIDWFILGDRDIGLHLVRSERLRAGEPLSSVTADLARRYGLAARLLPATDDRLRTRIVTPDGELAFQEWLVGHRAADPVSAVRFEGVPGARPAPGVLEAIESADRIVLAPSNPFVSLDPILAVDGVRAAIGARREAVVAITPMIGSQAVKGPLAGMLETLGHDVSAVGVAGVLAPLAGAFVLDSADEARSAEIRALGLRTTSVPTLMRDAESA